MLYRNRIFMTCNLIKPKHVSEFLNEIQKNIFTKNKFSVFYYFGRNVTFDPE